MNKIMHDTHCQLGWLPKLVHPRAGFPVPTGVGGILARGRVQSDDVQRILSVDQRICARVRINVALQRMRNAVL